MGGPIVRTGTTPAFWANWENVFGKGAGTSKSAAKADTKNPAKAKNAANSVKAKKKT